MAIQICPAIAPKIPIAKEHPTLKMSAILTISVANCIMNPSAKVESPKATNAHMDTHQTTPE